MRPINPRNAIQLRAQIERGSVSDNSNTQFAILALWIGRRHGVAVTQPLLLAERRFRKTAAENGGWGYGDAGKAIAGAAKKIEAVYSTPFLAHATMEPMNTTVRLTAYKAEAWVPTQNAEASLAALAEASGLPLEKCEVYRPDIVQSPTKLYKKPGYTM